MPTFIKSVIIHAPVEVVFKFHEREDALELLSPAFPPLKVIRKSGGISRGAWVEVKVGPWRWVALHTAYDKNRLFVDEQIEGPFSQ
jgi:ligand-binding SRPBCC domain-containing protein